jgi:hypothetical protein
MDLQLDYAAALAGVFTTCNICRPLGEWTEMFPLKLAHAVLILRLPAMTG